MTIKKPPTHLLSFVVNIIVGACASESPQESLLWRARSSFWKLLLFSLLNFVIMLNFPTEFGQKKIFECILVLIKKKKKKRNKKQHTLANRTMSRKSKFLLACMRSSSFSSLSSSFLFLMTSSLTDKDTDDYLLSHPTATRVSHVKRSLTFDCFANCPYLYSCVLSDELFCIWSREGWG